MYNVLVCDDDKDIVSALKIFLSSDGYNVLCAYNGSEAVAIVENNKIHLVIMDIMMPVKDGITALREIREKFNVPVIFATAKSEETDIVLGLNVGADDYITKPFNTVELLARVRSVIRRYTVLGSDNVNPDEITVGGITINDREKTVFCDGEKVILTPKEYEILLLLARERGRVFSPAEIYRAVWKDDPYGSDRTVAVHIRHIREKTEIDPNNPRYIRVIWGHGYKIEKETEE